jgi:FkbM family methyltransferase
LKCIAIAMATESLMTSIAHAGLARVGVRAFRLKTLPYGADEIQDVLRLASRAIEIVFDVGANVGRKSLRYARGFPQAKVYAFEPFSETFRTLHANTALQPNIEAVHCAMGAARGTQQARSIAGSSGWNSLQEGLNDELASASEELRVETVDEFCAERNIDQIDYLKTDTEGYDLEVLRGASGMLARQKIQIVLSECAFERSDRRHTNFFDLYRILEEHGYRFLGLCETIHTTSGPRRIDFTNALFGA